MAKSKITFVDLAGSERVYKSGSIHDSDRMEGAERGWRDFVVVTHDSYFIFYKCHSFACVLLALL